jgi:hypothetical protein
VYVSRVYRKERKANGQGQTGNISMFYVKATKRGIIRSALVKLYLVIHMS